MLRTSPDSPVSIVTSRIKFGFHSLDMTDRASFINFACAYISIGLINHRMSFNQDVNEH